MIIYYMPVEMSNIENILAYRHWPTIATYSKTYAINKSEAIIDFKEMLRFLYVASKTEKTLSPSSTVDKVRHIFLDNTDDYQSFCTTYLGRNVSHIPNIMNVQYYIDAKELLTINFGKVNQKVWPSITSPSFVLTECGSGE